MYTSNKGTIRLKDCIFLLSKKATVIYRGAMSTIILPCLSHIIHTNDINWDITFIRCSVNKMITEFWIEIIFIINNRKLIVICLYMLLYFVDDTAHRL